MERLLAPVPLKGPPRRAVPFALISSHINGVLLLLLLYMVAACALLIPFQSTKMS